MHVVCSWLIPPTRVLKRVCQGAAFLICLPWKRHTHTCARASTQLAGQISCESPPSKGKLRRQRSHQYMTCTHGLKKKTRGQPLYPYASVSVSIGFFFLCIGLQCFGSSGSKVATFPYKCSMRSTLCQLPAPAGNRNFQYKCSTQSTFWQLQLESSNFSVVCAGHFRSSGSKVAAFQCKQV